MDAEQVATGGEITNLKGSDKPMMIVSFYRHFNLRLGEWFTSLVAASMAWLLVTSPMMFDNTPYLRPLGEIANEATWGAYFGIIGLVRITALYINGRKPITPYVRMMFAFISCFAWFELALSLFLSGIPGVGLAVFPWVLFLEMYNVFRSSADAREVFDRTRAKRRNGTETA